MISRFLVPNVLVGNAYYDALRHSLVIKPEKHFMYHQSIKRLWKIPITFLKKQAMILMAILGLVLLMPLSVWAAGPGGIDTNLQLWLKADAGAYTDTGCTSAAADTNDVACWQDQSSNNYTVKQATGANQPNLTNNGINSNPVFAFNGSSDFLDTTDVLLPLLGAQSIFIVTATTSNSDVLIQEVDSVRINPHLGSDGAYVANHDNDSFIYSAGGGIQSGTPVINEATRNGSTGGSVVSTFQNGTSSGTATFPANARSANYERLSIGFRQQGGTGGIYLAGTLAEVIGYDTELSGADRNKVQSYLALKYGITLDSTIDYLASDSTTIYSSTGTHSGYINDITGIGRDDNSGLEQPKSSDVFVTIEHSSAFSSDQQFLIWGNDNGTTTEQTTELPSNISDRLGREWKVAEVNSDVGDIVLTLDASSLGLTGTAATLLIDTDGDSDFTTGTITRIGAETYVGGIATFTGNLGNGDVFTLATGCAGMLPNNVVDNIGDIEDCNNSSGNNTLLEAILYANAGDTITFDPSIAGQTITLTSQLDIDKNLTIDGGTNKITVSGNNSVQLFYLADNISFSIDGLSLTDSTGAIQTNFATTSSVLNVNNSSFINNNASGFNIGGAITNPGTTTVTNSTFNGNSTLFSGGAIFSTLGSVLTVKNSTFYNNTSTSSGGAINAFLSNLTLTNSTLFGNTAADGSDGAHLTIANANMQNNIIANGLGGGLDCINPPSTNINNLINNLIEDGSCSPTLTGDPMLGPLQNNGGTTQTMALIPGSPAINAGDNGTCEATDQRGITRPQTTTCDMGAYEKRAPAFASTAVTLVIVNDAYSYSITTTDNEPTDGAYPIISAPILPTWLTFTDNGDGTGTLTGTPTQTEVGTHNVTLRLNDGTEDIDQIFVITVNKIDQTISFGKLPDRTGYTDFTVSATATSGLPVSFSASGNCTISDNTVTLGRVGSCTITASQAGDGEYYAAPDVSQSFTIEAPIPSYKLTITPASGGTISGEGISCGSDCQQSFKSGTLVSLTATPYSNLILVSWGEDCDETGTVLINEDKTCSAQILPPNLNVSATTLNFIEGENATSYSLWLNTPPNAPVTITLTVDDEDLVLSETVFTFDETNWNVPQTIEVNHIDDDVVQGQHEHVLSHTVTSDDPNYEGLIIDDVSISVTDNDAPGIHLSGYEVNVTEGQTDDSYSITLTTQPLNDVTIQLSTVDSDNEPERTLLSPEILVFTVDNWELPQEVLVSVVDDNLSEGAHEHSPIAHQVTSNDTAYDGFFLSDVNVHVLDNDEPNLTLSSYQLNVTEGGTTAQTSLVLTTEPIQPVTVNLTAGAQISVSPKTLVFDSQNWNIPQTINVLAIEDDLVEGNHTNIILITTSSADVNYQGLSLDNNPTVSITDNDEELPVEELPVEELPIEEPLVEEPPLSEDELPVDDTGDTSGETDTSGNVSDGTLNDGSSDDSSGTNNDTSTANDNPPPTVNPVNNNPASTVSNQDNSTDSSFGITLDPLPELNSICAMRDNTISKVCKAEGQLLTEEVSITERASVSRLIIDGHVDNEGLISNAILTDTASLTGGKLTGYIVNLGTIRDAEFAGILLTGGTLAGTILNSGDGIIEDVLIAPDAKLVSGKVGRFIKCASNSILRDILMVPGTVLMGGRLDNGIRGYSGQYPGQIGAATILPGTILSNVRLSPTVEIPNDVIFGPGVLLPSSYENPILADFGANPNYIRNWHSECFPGEDSIISDVNALKANEIVFDISMLDKPPVNPEQGITCVRQMEPATFGVLEAEQVEQIPPAAFQGVSAEQISYLSEEAVAAVTIEQFEQLPAEAVAGLTIENMAGVNTDLIELFSVEHVAAINNTEFKQLESEQLSRFMVNFIDNNIGVTDVEFLLPPDWIINPITAALIAPVDSKLTLRYLQQSRDERHHVSGLVFLPNIMNFKTGFGLGGSGLSLFSGTRQALEIEELSEFLLSQNEETGILEVLGTGKYEGLLYTFIPDADYVFQVDGNQVPVGLSIGEGGFFTITMPDQVQYRVLPSPKDPELLSELLEGGQVVIGKRGEVLMDMPESNTRKSGKPRQVAMFSPLVQPAPDDLCVEIAPGETACDFEPGVDLPGNTRQREVAKVVYPDGTWQMVTPTVLSPEIFTELGFEFDGVEDIIFNADGTFYVLYQGQYYQIRPAFEAVQNEEIIEGDEPPAPGIVVNPETTTLTYTIAIEEPETNLRKRGEARQVMKFEPAIEAVPDDLCVEILPGDIVCDFE